MPGLRRSTVFTANLSGATGPVSAGTALLYNAAGTRLIVATDANRTATGRLTAGICLDDGDDDEVSVEVQFAGPLPPSVSGLGTGTATTVYIDADGALARGDGSEDDVVGECDTDGTVYLLCGGLYGAGGGGGGATPGGSDTQVQYNDGGALGGDAGLTYNETTNILTVTGAVKTGASPPNNNDGINVSYGYLKGVTSNNSTNNDQVNLVCLRDGTAAYGLGTDLVQIGAGAYNVMLVPGTGRTLHVWSDDGKINDGNGSEVASWNSYGFQFGKTTPDFGMGQGVIGLQNTLLAPSTNPTDGIIIYAEGNVLKYRTPAGTVVALSGSGSITGSDTHVLFFDGANSPAGEAGMTYAKATDVLSVVGAVAIGSGTKASAGALRFITSAGAVVAVRDSGNTADLHALNTNADRLYVGTDNAFTSANQFSQTHLFGSSLVQIGLGGSTYLYCQSSKIQHAQVVAGFSDGNLPFRFKRSAITITGNTTLTAAQYECVFIDLNGSPAGAFDVILPDSEGATFNIINNTGQQANIKRSGGAAAGLATGLSNWFHHNGTDYEARVDL
jgi:hypothetical protein